MAKQISDDALAAIEDAARRNPGGASAQQIMCALAAPIPLRTLQHRVKSLVTRNRLFMDGEGRWARYRMPGAAALATSDVVAREEAEDRAIPLSEAGISIRNYVRQALEARRPVGYDRKFLDQYRPNVSFYLTGQDRARLAAARDIVGRMVAASDSKPPEYLRYSSRNEVQERGRAAGGGTRMFLLRLQGWPRLSRRGWSLRRLERYWAALRRYIERVFPDRSRSSLLCYSSIWLSDGARRQRSICNGVIIMQYPFHIFRWRS